MLDRLGADQARGTGYNDFTHGKLLSHAGCPRLTQNPGDAAVGRLNVSRGELLLDRPAST